MAVAASTSFAASARPQSSSQRTTSVVGAELALSAMVVAIIYLPDDVHRISVAALRNPLLHPRNVLERIGADRLEIQERDAGGLESGDAVLDVALGADQRQRLQELGRYARLGGLLLATQVQILDVPGLLLVAVHADQVVVEVLVARAHPTHVQREVRTRQIPQTFKTFTNCQRSACRDFEWAEVGGAFFEAAAQCLAPDAVSHLGDEEDRQPALGNFGGQLDAAIAHGGQI